jgi:hypothetical protein
MAGMERLWQWCVRQWEDIRGHAKWAALVLLVAASGIGGTVTAWLVSILHRLAHIPQTNAMGYFIIGALVALVIAICFLVARREPKTLEITTSPVESSPAEEKEPTQTPIPKELDIFTERQQLHFKAAGPGEYAYRIFLKLKLTNRGPVSATVSKWDLWVSVGEDHTHVESLGVLPSNLAVRRFEYQAFSTGKESFEQLEPNLGDQVDRFPLVRGTPQAGWVCFYVSAWNGTEPAVNARLVLQITDSLGGTHFHIREPANFIRDGDIVEHEKPTLAITLIPPPQSGED